MTTRRALVLGGTEFIGVHLVETLVTSGWRVSLFNRGVTRPEAFAELDHLRGDRGGDVSALAGDGWDVAFDLSAFHPDHVSRTAEHLAGACEHYVLVSSISAYASMSSRGIDEDAPLAKIDGPVPDEVDNASYGPLKALCEERAVELYASTTIVRPTIVAGPLDPTDRFTYWVQRLSEPGRHVLPPDLREAVQYIDARDLAAWMVHLGGERVSGAFNAAAQPLPFDQFTQAISEVAGVPLRPIQLTPEQLAAEGVRPWVDLPLWLPPEDTDVSGMFGISTTRAAQAGLRTRPLEETVRDTLAWLRQRDSTGLRTGLGREREAELVKRYGGEAA